MGHRLSQLLDGFQSKVSAAAQTHSAPASYGVQPHGDQTPHGGLNYHNPSAPYGPPQPQATPSAPYGPQPQGPPTHYGPPTGHTPPPSYGALWHAPAPAPYGTPSQYAPPAPTGSPYPHYGQPAQHPPPASYGHNPALHSAPYGATNSSPSPSQQRPPHVSVSGPASCPSRVSIRSGGLASDSVTIHDANSPGAPALYAFRTSKSKPHIVMLHPESRTELGNGIVNSMGSSVQLSLRGQALKMKQNTMGDKFTFDSARGSLRWKVDQLTGKLSKLVDGNGGTVARYKSSGIPGMGEKSVEVCVPCDQQLLELILLSFMAASALNKQNNEVVSEVVQAVAGV